MKDPSRSKESKKLEIMVGDCRMRMMLMCICAYYRNTVCEGTRVVVYVVESGISNI